MATSFSSFRSPIVSSAAPSNRKPSANWWSPLFGWSSEPDYINGQSSTPKIEAGPEVRPEKSLFKGCFTEEKAKELRKKTAESSTFHDVMYHSAIASRLASDVWGSSDS